MDSCQVVISPFSLLKDSQTQHYKTVTLCYWQEKQHAFPRPALRSIWAHTRPLRAPRKDRGFGAFTNVEAMILLSCHHHQMGKDSSKKIRKIFTTTRLQGAGEPCSCCLLGCLLGRICGRSAGTRLHLLCCPSKKKSWAYTSPVMPLLSLVALP